MKTRQDNTTKENRSKTNRHLKRFHSDQQILPQTQTRFCNYEHTLPDSRKWRERFIYVQRSSSETPLSHDAYLVMYEFISFFSLHFHVCLTLPGAINQAPRCVLILRLLHIAALFIYLLVGLTYICMFRGNFNFL